MPSFDRPSHPPTAPSAWIERFQPLICSGGIVLDLACGSGRHTRFLYQRGHRVVAADLDITGLSDLTDTDQVEIRQVDLETEQWPFDTDQFDAIVMTNYVHRPHFPHLLDSLRPDGILLIETFGAGNAQFGRPRNPDFLLQPGELLSAFGPHMTIISYEHGVETVPRPAVRQRLCASADREALHDLRPKSTPAG